MRKRQKASLCTGSTTENSCCPKEQTLRASNRLSARMEYSQWRLRCQQLKEKSWFLLPSNKAALRFPSPHRHQRSTWGVTLCRHRNKHRPKFPSAPSTKILLLFQLLTLSGPTPNIVASISFVCWANPQSTDWQLVLFRLHTNAEYLHFHTCSRDVTPF